MFKILPFFQRKKFIYERLLHYKVHELACDRQVHYKDDPTLVVLFQKGDIVEVKIDKIGTIITKIV